MGQNKNLYPQSFWKNCLLSHKNQLYKKSMKNIFNSAINKKKPKHKQKNNQVTKKPHTLPHATEILVQTEILIHDTTKKQNQKPETKTECYLYLYAHLLAGKPDLDLPCDPDLQQEKNKAQQSSQWHAHTVKVS